MTIIQGDCIEKLKELIDAGLQVQSVVTDPPYALSFMGKEWDNEIAFDPTIWRLCLNLLPPGGHLVAFGGTRTYHRLCCAVEDAGFEIRDQLAWVYGSGLPKALDVHNTLAKTDPEAALTWKGWKTTLKPAHEPIVLARKPITLSVVQNVLEHGTAAMNIDACRVPIDEEFDDPRLGGKGTWGTSNMAKTVYGDYKGIRVGSSPIGRYPPNLIHDGSDEVLEVFESYGQRGGGDKRGQCHGRRPAGFGAVGHATGDSEPNATVYNDSGSAARFFQVCPYTESEQLYRLNYCPKAKKSERRESSHPTIKPVTLVRWLVKLITPPCGLVLDPFAGTGTTGEAAELEGFEYVLIESNEEYVADIKRRLKK